MLQTKWSGKNYSARIWTNTRKVATEIQSTILQAIHRGYSIQRLSKNLAQRMNVAYTNAERLILTELNAVENRASADAMRAADFEYYQFVATLDRRTCPICGERDGEVYPLSSMNQGENAPPMHPRCRCTIIAHMEGVGRGQRAAGRTRVAEDVTYAQWKARYVGGMQRRTANQGAFSHLKVPMQKRAVTQICQKYGVDIAGLRIKIQRSEELLKYFYAGSAAPEDVGRIDLFANAFIDEEQLIRTVIHEGCHVKQFKKYGAAYVQDNRFKMEVVAERYENFFLRIVERRIKGG